MIRMLVALGTAILLALPTLSAGRSHAECCYNGKAYPEGVRVGETVCRNGTWVEE